MTAEPRTTTLIGSTEDLAPHDSLPAKVVVALHDGFYGASSGTGFSNRAMLEVLARTLPPGRLLVLPAEAPGCSGSRDRTWTLQTERMLDSAGAEIRRVPLACPDGASVHDSETLCQVVGDVVREQLAPATRSHVIALDTPFLGIAPHLDGSDAGLLLVPRSTTLLADPDNHRRVHWERAGLTAAVDRGARVAAISHHMRSHLTYCYGVPRTALVDLPNGLLIRATAAESTAAPVPPRARAGFLFALGRAVESKGFEDLLQALVHLREQGIRVPHLVLAATADSQVPTPYQRRLREQARDSALDVTLLGRFSPAYRGWMHNPALRAVVVPSRAEPFGRIPLEAFAARASPVVATRVGGLTETVVDGETGFTAEPRNPVDLANAIHRALLISACERERFRRQGHALLASRHDYGVTIRAYLREHIPWALETDVATRRPF
ncbi:glycosyltransferase family 4 protein [Streptomyces sp. TRM66268-LWL]|uniref:D-inositol 3-phosphate glycosyltransferase n=1 Tax=Streptomyces polyasparticus TaxID=2767826 RepID=A0ABR7SSP9_9ACTN|nr:glycosyltransferase family 4 protein [Streptomyces polyasparticus]MBC9717819.1 glycosyltransferase family 4 protein [Streptomyces polyasparticus]